jgi:hypothetical protein
MLWRETYKGSRIGAALKPEGLKVDLMQSSKINDRVVASSVKFLLVGDKVLRISNEKP